MLIYSLHPPSPLHLETVIKTMKVLGSPLIHVVDCGEYFQALEGSHRLAACEQLHIIPRLRIYQQEDVISWQNFDLDFMFDHEYLYNNDLNLGGIPKQLPAGELIGMLRLEPIEYNFTKVLEMSH